MYIDLIKEKICKYITSNKRILSLVLIIFIFFSIFLISSFFVNRKSNYSKSIYSINDYIQNLNSINVSNNKKEKNNEDKGNIERSYKFYDDIDTFLTIPVLNMYNAPISEGTSQSVMKNYIGHFSCTSYEKGNIGLASHNRGSGATYFKDLYKLKVNDYIFYTYKNVTKKYKVNKIVVIDSYDWSYLENTNENKLTLITCINDKPEFRLCVQALQI